MLFFNFNILYRFPLESLGFNDIPDTLAPIDNKMNESQAPLKPVCPVISILLFL